MNIFINLGPNIHYDICAMFVLAMIFFSFYFRKMTKGSLNLAFMSCVIVTFFTTMVDMFSVLFYEPLQNTSKIWLFYLVHTSYYLLRNLNLPVYIIYIITNIGVWSVLKKSSFLKKMIMILPYAGVVVLLFINFFVPVVFHYDVDSGFIRDSGRSFLYIVSVYYMCLALYFILKYRKIFGATQTLSLISIFPLTFISLMIQNVDFNMLVEMFATTLVILLASITVHRPEMMVHSELGTMTKYAFMDELRRIEGIQKPVTIMYIALGNYRDIQSFVPYNTMVGMLRQIFLSGTKLMRECGYKGNVFYLENGVFAIISDKVEKSLADKFAQKTYENMNITVQIDKLDIHLIPKICYYDCPDDLKGYDELFSFSKSFETLIPAGKGSVDVATLTSTKDFKIRSDIDSIISNAISNNLFKMYYQPIWSIEQQKFISAEALIRLNDPKYGFVSPEIFIAAAERNGTIYQIGDFVVDDVCRFIASEGFKKTGIRYIEINLAVAQCLQADLVEKIKQIVAKHKIDFSQVNLEVTERENIIDQQTFDANMRGLCNLGISLSLDDYGTGYSNIRRISEMPLDIVKIDKSFVDLMSDKDMHSIIENTARMLKDINKEIVVEGVEDEATLKEFERMKCDFIQGYYFSKPLPESDFVNFCIEKNK